jgi:hypothetical protein
MNARTTAFRDAGFSEGDVRARSPVILALFVLGACLIIHTKTGGPMVGPRVVAMSPGEPLTRVAAASRL